MKSQKAPYPPHVIKTIAGIMASKDVCAPNYLKGPELVGLFQSLGFPDSYTFVEGRGIQPWILVKDCHVWHIQQSG